jgi:predicted nucleic acid-binding protein
MVVLDATILMLFFRPDVNVPLGPGGKEIESPKARVDYLIERLEKSRTKIVVPTPVMSEILVRAGPQASQRIVEELNRLAVFRVEPFDAMAAIEVAAMTRNSIDGTGKKRGKATGTWAKIKFDRQIVAIAKVTRATTIYSDDRDIRAIASAESIPVVGLSDLPLPDKDSQPDLFEHQEVDDEPPPQDDLETDEGPSAPG